MAKKKKKECSLDIFGMPDVKPKLNNEKVKAMEAILKDDGLRNLTSREMQNLVDAYNQGKKSK